MARSAIDIVQELVKGRMEFNHPMSKMTTIRAGGPADLVIFPSGREDLTGLMRFFGEHDIERTFIGSGSTFVVRDGGIRGAVVCLREGLNNIGLVTDWSGSPQVKAEAGVEIGELLDWSTEKGFRGLEFLSGIPGTVGGAVVNNSGGWGREVADCLVEIETIDTEGRTHRIMVEDLALGYRSSKVPEGQVVVSATFKGTLGTPDQIEEEIRDYYTRRRAAYPLTEATAGMIFLNPEGQSPAGELIDRCGLKGVRVGEAEISKLHANFIVNFGEAKAGQIVSLIGMIQERVYVKFKLKLDTRVTIAGAWEKAKIRIQE